MIPKSGYRFSDKIMLEQELCGGLLPPRTGAECRNEQRVCAVREQRLTDRFAILADAREPMSRQRVREGGERRPVLDAGDQRLQIAHQEAIAADIDDPGLRAVDRERVADAVELA